MAREVTSRIKSLLEQKNMSQKKLSDLTGITESAISRYISGDRIPRGTNLMKIAKALGVTTDELLGAGDAIDKERDLGVAKALIARNASNMTQEEKLELMALLLADEKGAK